MNQVIRPQVSPDLSKGELERYLHDGGSEKDLIYLAWTHDSLRGESGSIWSKGDMYITGVSFSENSQEYKIPTLKITHGEYRFANTEEELKIQAMLHNIQGCSYIPQK